MRTNVEIKAKLPVDLSTFRSRVESLNPEPVVVIEQEDTFFHAPNARLKLRVLNGTESQSVLISYKRSDIHGPKVSLYEKVPVKEPENLKRTLSMALGVKGSVSKTRYLYIIGQTRIHCDHVKDLGYFMELEVMLNEDQNLEDGELVAKDLMRKLGIMEDNLVKGAYLDLLSD